MKNIPEVKLGLVAVSRDCFVISLSERRRAAVVKAYKGEVYEAKTTVENEKDMLKAVEEIKAAGCNALVVLLGNFGPETPETLIAKYFTGPVMYVASAEESGDDLIDGRGAAQYYLLEAYKHLKPILLAGDSRQFKGLLNVDSQGEEGIVEGDTIAKSTVEDLLSLVAAHRVWSRAGKAATIPA